MRVELSKTDTMTVRDAQALDPVTVFLQDFGAGRGRITIECYGRAWSTFFGNYGSENLRAFLINCDVGYLASRVEDGSKSMTARDKERAYLERIVRAMQDALKETR